jgi:hypothetical protein
VFAPLLIFFAVTGAWQTFMLHQSSKAGYRAPRILQQLSSVHQDQRFPINSGPRGLPSIPFRWFVLAMSVGFVLTAILGIAMAFKFTRERWIVWLCLLVGILLPVLLLYIGGGIK